MKIIAIVDTEDCGPFVIIDPELISLVKILDYYFVALFCSFTGRALSTEISEEVALKLMKNGVKCLNSEEKI